jgi:hypothetical protein
VLPLRDGELIDRQPVVVLGHFEIDHPHLRPGHRPVLPPVLDRDAIDNIRCVGALRSISDGASSRASLR